MASTDISTLEPRLNDLADRLTNSVELLMTDVITFIGTAVVILTPVDTGFARANWRPSLNAPAPTPISFLDPTGTATISRIELVAKLWRVGQTAFITNRAPYIQDLNEGSSPQAVDGFVELAVLEGLGDAVQKHITTPGGLLENAN